MKSHAATALRLAALAVIAGSALWALPQQSSAAGPEPTAIAVAVPASATLGQVVTVQARLVSSAGPIAGAPIAFAIPTAFLNAESDVIVARGTTDKEGLAVATFEARRTGAVEVKAVFEGSLDYAAATASGPISIDGAQQLYLPDVGIRLRGLNSTPIGQNSRFAPWLLSGWPIGAALVLIWSLYATAVFFMSQIAADATHDSAPTEARR